MNGNAATADIIIKNKLSAVQYCFTSYLFKYSKCSNCVFFFVTFEQSKCRIFIATEASVERQWSRLKIHR